MVIKSYSTITINNGKEGGDIMLALAIGWLIRASLDDFKVERWVLAKIKEKGEANLQGN